jgi:hypothetical protein
LTIASISYPSGAFRVWTVARSKITLAALSLSLSATPFCVAQTPLTFAPARGTSGAVTTAALSLPDSPGFVARTESSSSNAGMSDPDLSDAGVAGMDDDDSSSKNPIRMLHKTLSHHNITIEPGQTVPVLTAHQKRILGLEQSFTVFSAVGWVASAGYGHLFNGSPNYGTDSGAFGMRLGATAVRATSQNIFSNAVFAPLFHEDPRYYKLGNGHNPIKRVAYAATRAMVTRRDDGTSSVNYSLLAGNLAGAVLTNAYYPQLNQGFGQTAKTFGTSVGGSAVGFVVSEFLYDALYYSHLRALE